MAEEVWLSTAVAIKRFRVMEKAPDRSGLADFIFGRLSERYITPVVTGERNGFAMMACACLSIETLESFYNGWKTAEGVGPGETAFKQFFRREPGFAAYHENAKAFDKNVRSGIMHQGETKGGWRINRRQGAPAFNPETKTTQATKFLDALSLSLGDYREALKKADWKSDLWRNFRRKMDAIIKNCEAKS